MTRFAIANFFQSSRPKLDNFVFRCHYRLTVVILLACAVVLFYNISYGVPITCTSSHFTSQQFIEQHCWDHGTYTVTTPSSMKVGSDIPYPGISLGRTDERKNYHTAHRWVIIAVLVQAAFFYLPHVFWRCLEEKLVRQFIFNTNGNSDTVRTELIVNYLKSFSWKNLMYACGLLFCEILNLINVVVQLFLICEILQIRFPKLDLFADSRAERTDASALSSFPLRSMCEMLMYGPSGAVQKIHVQCIMSVNTVIEYVFICQWIWFAVLTPLSVLALIYRLVTFAVLPLRVLLLSVEASLTNPKSVKKVASRLTLGEFFVTYMISKKLDPVHTKEILDGLADCVTGHEQLYPLSEIQNQQH